MIDLIFKRSDVNTEFLHLCEWLVDDRKPVRKGQAVCAIETSKALIEIESPCNGILIHMAKEGEEIGLSNKIAVVAESEGEVKLILKELKKTKPKPKGKLLCKATKKAVEFAKEHNVNINLIKKKVFITKKDVIDYLGGQKVVVGDKSKIQLILKGIATDGITFPHHVKDEKKGIVDIAFLQSLRLNTESFRNLNSDEKCEAYKKHGAMIGGNVTLGKGTVIIAPQIIIGNGSKILDNGIIQCREKFVLGELSYFGPNLEMNCEMAIIGSNIHAGRNIRVGGGGHNDPWAVVIIGDTTYIGDDVFINTCRPILIGKEVFLTQRSILVTHNIGHSVLEGYENRFAPICLEDRSQVGMNSTIYAGSRIGQDAIVGSNSYVVSAIPAGKFVIGVPAKVIGNSSHRVSHLKQVELSKKIISDYHELLKMKGYEVDNIFDKNGYGFILKYEKKRFMIAFIEKYEGNVNKSHDIEEKVILTLNCRKNIAPEECVIVDLLGKVIYGTGGLFSDSTREFLRKRGIRLTPRPWRYSGGLI